MYSAPVPLGPTMVVSLRTRVRSSELGIRFMRVILLVPLIVMLFPGGG